MSESRGKLICRRTVYPTVSARLTTVLGRTKSQRFSGFFPATSNLFTPASKVSFPCITRGSFIVYRGSMPTAPIHNSSSDSGSNNSSSRFVPSPLLLGDVRAACYHQSRESLPRNRRPSRKSGTGAFHKLRARRFRQ